MSDSEATPVAPVAEETGIIYYKDDDKMPYRVRVNKSVDQVTLGDFKTALNQTDSKVYKFFFKIQDKDIGEVKEEIHDDNAILPLDEKGRIISFLVTAESSSHSDGSGNRGTNGKLHHPVLPAINEHNFHQAAMHFDQTGATDDSSSTISGLPRHLRKHNPPPPMGRRAFNQYDSTLSSYCDRPRSAASLLSSMASGASYNLGNHQYKTRGARRGDAYTDDDSYGDNTNARLYDTEDDDQSRVSTSTDITSVSRQYMARQRKKRRRYRQPASRASTVTSVTESSMSLNVMKVVLNMDMLKDKYLGISIVGHTVGNSEGGIYVANIMEGGAVALDGRIQTGDMILEVNDIAFDEHLSNDDAVRVLREAVLKPGPIELTVCKTVQNNYASWGGSIMHGGGVGAARNGEPRGYFSIGRHDEPVRPIDPGAWVMHTNAMRALPSIMEGSEGAPTPTPGMLRPHSAGTGLSGDSGVSGPNMAYTMAIDINNQVLTTQMDMKHVAHRMALPHSGLNRCDRTWLKITIPNAFLGKELVEWLLTTVQGLRDNKDARKYATRLLKEGHIKHTVNKITFSDQCYYVMAEHYDFGAMSLEDNGGPMNLAGSQASSGSGHGKYTPQTMATQLQTVSARSTPLMGMQNHRMMTPQLQHNHREMPALGGSLGQASGVAAYRAWLEQVQRGEMGDGMMSDHDTVGPLPPPPQMMPPSSHSRMSHGGTPFMMPHALPQAYGAQMMHTQATSVISDYVQMAWQDARIQPTSQASNTNGKPMSAVPVALAKSEASHSQASQGSQGSQQTSSSGKGSQVRAARGPPLPPKPSGVDGNPSTAGPSAALIVPTGGADDRDMAGSRQSFRMAMGNPCEFFVDVM